MTFSELLTEILDRLNLSSTDAQVRVARAINRKYRTVTSSIGLDPSRRSTVQTTIGLGASTITFTNTEKVISVYDRSISPYKKLDELTIDELEQLQPFTARDNPTQWALQSHTANTVTIVVNRVAQTAFTLYADVDQAVADLSGSNTPAFPESFHDILIEGVLSDELRKMEKPQLAVLAQREYERILSDLRMWIAKSAFKDIYQGKTASSPTSSGGGGSGSGFNGALSWTETGLVTFDRDPLAPFAVTASSAVVPNLKIDDVGVVFTDNITGDVTSSKHGYAPKSLADATKFLNSAATPVYALVKDSDLSTSDITTNDVSTSKHGFVPKGTNNPENFLRSDASYAAAFGLINQGRLTLTTGTPVTTSDVTGAATVYLSPYIGNRIAIYNGTNWKLLTFTEPSLALGTIVKAQAYDVFAYDNSGTVTLEAAEWANATITMTSANPGVVTWTANGMVTGNSITFTTSGALPTNVVANTQYFITVVDANTFKLSTSRANVAAGTFIDTTAGAQSGTHTGHQPQARATAITRQNGVWVKSGATTRRYLGSFFTSATTTTEDSVTKRYLYNVDNRLPRTLQRIESTNTWTYQTNTFRQANASVSNQVEIFVGTAESSIDLFLHMYGASDQAAGTVIIAGSIGEDLTNTQATASGAAIFHNTAANVISAASTHLNKFPTVGLHAYIWLEKSTAVGTTTWYGQSNNGLFGLTFA